VGDSGQLQIILAILRAQWLSMRLRVGTRRAGALFGAITSFFFYGIWGLIALGLAGFFSSRDNAGNFLPLLSSGLLFVMLYWQLAPVISAGFGASLELRKLLAYPIEHGTLFAVEVLLRLSTCAEMLILLAGASIGLMRNPLYGASAAPLILAGALTFSATNLLLSAGVRQVMERLFMRTRMREAMMLLVFIAAILPQLFLFMKIRKSTLLSVAPQHLVWPWVAAASVMLRSRVLPAGVLMLCYLGIAWWFGRRQFERGIRHDGAALKKPEREARIGGLAETIFRLPGRLLPDPLGAMVEKELRTLARIPRFRMVYGMSCVFGIVLYLPALRNPHPHSFMIENSLPFMALYGLLMLGPISYWNAFGFDRSAVEGYFSWPVLFRDALLSKNITVVMLLIPQIMMVSLVGKAGRMPISAGKFVETLAVMLIASLYWFAMGNIWSVRMPRAMDPEKMNQMAGKMQALGIWAAPFLLLPIGLAYWARAVFGNELIFAGVLAIAAAVGGVFYKVGLDSAVSASGSKREAMLMQLSKSDGPLSVT
jgi:ABC-2 type transport system permease protein